MELLKLLQSYRERRRHTRRDEPRLTVLIGDRRYRTVDWSHGGFQIRVCDGDFAPGESVRGVVETVGSAGPGEFEAEVAWSEDGRAGFRFVSLPRLLYLSMIAMRPH